ncbi:MAG: hypothetical protein II596_04250 [Thermoguttaceae bacterium]|nr:hypothetical protein [Thermoguttaceae bacterium]
MTSTDKIKTLIILLGIMLSVNFKYSESRCAEPTLTLVAPQVERAYSEQELDAIANSDSQRHETVDGYVADARLVALFSEFVYCGEVDGADVRVPFRLRTPSQLRPGRRYPLVVLFHGYGESDDDNTRQLSHLHYAIRSFAGPDRIDAFVLATQCPKDCSSWDSAANRYGAEPIKLTEHIIEALEKEFPIDPRRVAALGVCSGANAARALSEERPELFCALALCGYSPSSINTDRFPAPTWAFNNTHDEIASIKNVRAAIKNARSRGDSVWLTERPGVHDSWSRALRDDRAVSWLAARAQTDALPPPPYTVCGRKKTAGELATGLAAPLAALCLVFWGSSQLCRPKRTRNS